MALAGGLRASKPLLSAGPLVLRPPRSSPARPAASAHAQPPRRPSSEPCLAVHSEEHQEQEQHVIEMRAVVQERSAKLAGVQPARPLALGDAPPAAREGVLAWLARVASETFLVARLAIKLFGYVGLGELGAGGRSAGCSIAALRSCLALHEQ